MKKILGLDLGTNSIGWSLIEQNFDKKEGSIKGIGTRIIPMSQDILGKFDSGVSISQTAERTDYRGVRRLRQRTLLRRDRLHRVLNILGFLPEHYANEIDFNERLGQFFDNKEPKIAYKNTDEGQFEFLFKNSFEEMRADFKENQPSLFYNKKNGEETKIPYDWTLYYLRKKALSKKISKQELAWIILNFNQKRGYYQLRGEEEETDNSKTEEFYSLKVINVEATDDKNAKGTWYNVILENNWVYRRQSKEPLDNWIGKNKEFIVTTQLESDGSPKLTKDGDVNRSFRSVDSEKDWIAIKKKTEQEIEASKKTVGQFIYETLLIKPDQKIRGKLVKTIERKFYKDELNAILRQQQKEHPELKDKEIYKACIEELYPRNEPHQNNIKDKDAVYLLMEDIIFYQRPLRSQKSSISGCSYEYRTYKKLTSTKDFLGNNVEKEIIVKEPLKAVPKSHPLYQEFRLWQFLRNLKIYQKEGYVNDKPTIDIDVTDQILDTEEDWVDLFDDLNKRKEIDQKQLIQYFVANKKIPKTDKENYRWNNVEDKKYPCNETRSQFLSRLKKVENVNPVVFLTPEVELALWHIVYSVTDKKEFEKALGSFATKNQIDKDTFLESFKKMPPYDSDYGAYSLKALKKLLPLMRKGKYWNLEVIPEDVKDRVASIIERLEHINFNKDKIDENIADDDIPKQLLKSFLSFQNENPLKGLNTYQASYAVYERHSEVGDITYWKTPNDIDKYLQDFKQHSLRNPIVEQVVTETLRVVKDIWETYGHGEENFFDEIHVELGREMKNPADKRKSMTEKISENENTNYRIKELLKELVADPKVEGDIRPYSPSHQEILKIYEEGVYQSLDKVDDDIVKVRKNNSPSKSDIIRYKLWLEQGYISPYTGQTIPLSKLFTTDYQIEHIIPQSRYFDDSLSNKIICESAVNELKDNRTAYEFIKNSSNVIVDLGFGKTVKILDLENYEKSCNKSFRNNRNKLKLLLSEEIPEGFINRQLNDSRYISKLIKGLLSNLVREENEQEATSKKVITIPGAITSKLKQDWGLNDKWNEIISYRFKRLNEITKSNDFGFWDDDINAFRIQIPDELSKGFNKKRIDHRHHALDALVIACTTRKHVQYLNALNSEKKNYSLRDSLLIKNEKGDYTKHFQLPWKNFTINAKNAIEKIIVSFKQNNRVINKAVNKTMQWQKNNDGQLKKGLVKQTKGESWAIRKPLHKETVYGKVQIKRKKKAPVSINSALDNYHLIINKNIKALIQEKKVFYKDDSKLLKKYFKENPIVIDGEKIDKIEIFEVVEATAGRTELNEKFTRKQLESITDSGIQAILENHIKNYTDGDKERFDLAFNQEGIDDLNKNIHSLNNGNPHKPIYKVRVYEEGNRFAIGEIGNKKDKYVEAAKGTNLFFSLYWNKEKKSRVYETIPLNVVIEHQKQTAHLPKEERIPVPVDSTKGQFLFSLSPNDLVYVPTDEEIEDPSNVNFQNLTPEQTKRIFTVNDFSDGTCYFVPNSVAKAIVSKEIDMSFNDEKNKITGSFDTKTASLNGDSIKYRCWKLYINRLGNITNVIKAM